MASTAVQHANTRAEIGIVRDGGIHWAELATITPESVTAAPESERAELERYRLHAQAAKAAVVRSFWDYDANQCRDAIQDIPAKVFTGPLGETIIPESMRGDIRFRVIHLDSDGVEVAVSGEKLDANGQPTGEYIQYSDFLWKLNELTATMRARGFSKRVTAESTKRPSVKTAKNLDAAKMPVSPLAALVSGNKPAAKPAAKAKA